MNSIPERHQTLSKAARHALQDVQQATRESLIQPITEGTRELAQKARSSCNAMAQSTRHDVEEIERWACQHPLRSVSLAFGAGVFLGIALFRWR
jgi:ElaB/YqjD/DUF883 family membrane-anchored ribosome-binding protein